MTYFNDIDKKNKDLLVVNLTFSLVPFVLIAGVAIAENFSFVPLRSANLQTFYQELVIQQPVIGLLVIICILSYFTNFVTVFFINTKWQRLLWAIKIASWFWIFSTLNWVLDIWLLITYNKWTDLQIKDKTGLMKLYFHDLKLFVLFFSVIAVILVFKAELDQFTWGSNYYVSLFIPSALFSMIFYGAAVTTAILLIIFMIWLEEKKIIFTAVALVIFPWIVSLILLCKKEEVKKPLIFQDVQS